MRARVWEWTIAIAGSLGAHAAAGGLALLVRAVAPPIAPVDEGGSVTYLAPSEEETGQIAGSGDAADDTPRDEEIPTVAPPEPQEAAAQSHSGDAMLATAVNEAMHHLGDAVDELAAARRELFEIVETAAASIAGPRSDERVVAEAGAGAPLQSHGSSGDSSFRDSRSAAPAQAALGASRPPSPARGNPAPAYPELARRRRQAGTAVIHVVVEANGTPSRVSIGRSSGFETLDDAAMSAVRRWRFIPATEAGTSIRSEVDLPVRFILRD